MLTAGLQLHWTRMKATAGVAGTWHRGALNWPMTLVPGQSLTTTEIDTGVSVEEANADFIAQVAEFVAVVGDMPMENDKFTYADVNGVISVHEVNNPLGEKPWRYHDSQRVMIRIHCVEVED